MVFLGLALLSCHNELEQETDVVVSSLAIEVTNRSVSMSLLGGVYMPDHAEIGVFLRAEDGTTYDSKNYDNIKYTSSGTENTQTWEEEQGQGILLTRTKGTAYAYYPRQEAGVSFTQIPITNDGTDWMYTASPATNLYNLNNQARFDMVHALTIIRCKITRRNYSGGGVVQFVGVQGDALAHGGMLSLEKAAISDFSGVGQEILKENVGTLGDQPLVVDLWAVPVGTSGTLTFSIKVDGRIYTVGTAAVNPLSGTVYNYSLMVDGESLVVSGLTLTEWIHSTDMPLDSEFDTSDYSVDWATAKATDGIYAITTEGRALAYEYVAGNSYKGVAFTVNGKAYQVSTYGCQPENGSDRFYWWKENWVDIPSLNNYLQASDDFENGYLPFPNGTYLGDNYQRYMDGDWTKWTGFDPVRSYLSDFKGKANTAAIIVAQTVNGEILENTATWVLTNFRMDEARNEGYQDWFIPACGELAFMFRNMDEMNDLLRRVGGDMHNGGITFSSTEVNDGNVACVHFGTGMVLKSGKTAQQRFRFIREL